MQWPVSRATASGQYALPRDAARNLGAVVVGFDGETLLLAVAGGDTSKARALAAAARRPVRLVEAAPAEVELMLSRFSGREALQVRLNCLLSLIDDFRLDHVVTDEHRRSLVEAGDVASLNAALAGLPDGWGQELMGLLDGLPHLGPGVRFDPALQLLLPPELRESGAAAVWGAQGNTLFLACSQPPTDEILTAVAAWTGMTVRCGLVEPTCVRALAARRDGHSHPRLADRGERRPPVDRSASREKAVNRAARAVAQQRREPLLEVERRLGAGRHRSQRAPIQPEAGALAMFPTALLRSLRFVPLDTDGRHLEVAVPAGRGECAELRGLLTALTGQAARFREEPADELARFVARLSDRERGEPPEEAGGGWLTTLLTVTENSSLRCSALAMFHSVPWIRLEHYRMDPTAISALSHEHRDRLRVVPLRRDGNVLWVVMESPTPELVDELSSLTGLSVRPLVAASASIAHRLASLEGVRSVEIQERLADHPVVTWLQGAGLANKTELLRLLVDASAPIDQALDDAGVLAHPQFSETAARLAGLPLVDLRLRPQPEEIVDALGQRVRRTVWKDPVDHSVAGIIPHDAMREAAVLPAYREDGALVVAVADPFDRETRALLEALKDEPVKLAVAPRPAILTAIARSRGAVPLGDRLLAHGMVSPPELARALDLHRKTGVRLGRALLTLGMVTQEQLAYVLSEQRELPFFRLSNLEPDVRVARLLPEETERRLGVVPLYRAADSLTVATPDPLNQAALDEAAARTGLSVLPVVCTEGDFDAMLETLYHEEYLDRSTSELVARSPEESASRVLNASQRFGLMAIVAAFLLVLVRSPGTAGLVAAASASAFYVAFSLYRSYLIYRALSHNLEVPVSDEEIAALDDTALPIYTILVPLYREASVLPTLILGLSKLDYPATKLDVKLLLEEDDIETRIAVDTMPLPDYVRPVVVPAANPRCKPKACNYGLIHARGDYVVIYDAEDVPDPDQLKKAVIGFQKSGPDVTCLQAKLNYYNSKQNLLTSWFTTEYSMWFDLFLPGLDAAEVPIPLGGTSNHFPTATLREVGAWDPYNVTEDADLGIRLFRRGYKTGVLNSTTLEEANSEVYNWIRQRSRWVKGYIQTYLVHMRHPVRLWRAVGTKAFFSFNMVVGGTFLGFLLNPIFWSLTALWYMAHAGFVRSLYPGPVYYLGMFSLVVGNFSFVYLNVAGCLRRGHYSMVKHALLTPLYWGMMSLAAWKGFLQLWTNPFYWEKTTHGLYRRERPAHSGSAES